MPFAQQEIRPLIKFTLAPLFEEQGIPLAVMGILVVFMVLVLLASFIKLLPMCMASPTPTTEKQPVNQSPLEEGLSPEMVAVIAAAVAETMSKPHRIVRIRGLTPEDLGWSLDGRIQHHQSHRVQSRGRR